MTRQDVQIAICCGVISWPTFQNHDPKSNKQKTYNKTKLFLKTNVSPQIFHCFSNMCLYKCCSFDCGQKSFAITVITGSVLALGSNFAVHYHPPLASVLLRVRTGEKPILEIIWGNLIPITSSKNDLQFKNQKLNCQGLTQRPRVHDG